MLINFQQINPDDFKISERNIKDVGKVFLITPTFAKHSWSKEEYPLRSLLCLPDGKIVSSGFMKFFNYGEKPSQDELLRDSILKGTSWYTEKMDGSLVIRSVINGKVNIRTRGSHTMEDGFFEPINKLISEKYPNLLDPSKDAQYSILFEYTSPENKVVVSYQESSLTVLGMMDLNDFPPKFVSSPEILKRLESDYGTQAVKFFKLPDSLEEIIKEIRNWRGIEGVVVWSRLDDGSLMLTKIKSSEYIRIHALKFQFSEEKLIQYFWYQNIKSVEELKDEFFKLGVDWESISFIEPIFFNYLELKNKYSQIILEFLEKIDSNQISLLESKKEKVFKLQELSEENKFLFSVGIQYLNGSLNVEDVIASQILGISLRSLENHKKTSDFSIKKLQLKE